MILNGALLAIPIAVFLFIYASLWIQIARIPDSANGEPVRYATYDHELVGLSGPMWPVFAFFLIPNLLLLAMYGRYVIGRKLVVKE